MKKFLLTVALILAVVTSLTAGTMAAYTQTLSITGNDVATKEFNFTSAGSKNFSEEIKLAPGDKVSYRVEVKNASEVSSNFTVTAETLGDLVSANGPVTMTLYDADGQKLDGKTFDKASVAKDGRFAFNVEISWAYANGAAANAADNELKTKASQLKVTVNGVSANEAGDLGTGESGVNNLS